MKPIISTSLAVLAVSLVQVARLSADPQAAVPPNLVILVADDLGYADLSCQPDAAPDVDTPNIDRLAETGILFTQAYSASPICSASRLAFHTGRYPHRWGSYWYNEGGLPPEEMTLAQALKQRGYRTMKIGKVHLDGGPVEHPLDHGFDQFLGFRHHSWDFNRLHQRDVDAYEARKPGSTSTEEFHWFGPLTRNRDTKESFENISTTELFGKEGAGFIAANAEGPFFLQIEFNAVHTPVGIAPLHYEDRYPLVQPEWKPDPEAAAWPYPYWDPLREDYKTWYRNAISLGIIDPFGRQKYLAHLAALDDAVGAVLDALEAAGVRGNTLVVFTSDNGGSHESYANNDPLTGFKFSLIEGGIRVPLVASLPDRVPGGLRSPALVSLMDIFPTMMDLVGDPDVKPFDGKSWQPVFDDPSTPVHDILFWDLGLLNSWAARDAAGWKAVVYSKPTYTILHIENGIVDMNRRDEFRLPEGDRLYYLDSDIAETTNRLSDFPERFEVMKQRHTDWRAGMAEPIKYWDKY